VRECVFVCHCLGQHWTQPLLLLRALRLDRVATPMAPLPHLSPSLQAVAVHHCMHIRRTASTGASTAGQHIRRSGSLIHSSDSYIKQMSSAGTTAYDHEQKVCRVGIRASPKFMRIWSSTRDFRQPRLSSEWRSRSLAEVRSPSHPPRTLLTYRGWCTEVSRVLSSQLAEAGNATPHTCPLFHGLQQSSTQTFTTRVYYLLVLRADSRNTGVQETEEEQEECVS
jgi:hypothetical protein